MGERDTDPIRELMLVDDPGFDEVLRCVFGIQMHEARAYLVLLEHPDSTVAELASVLEKDRSSANRAMTTLLDRGLVIREHRLLEGGGYVYQYTAIPLSDVKELMHAALDEWTTRMHDHIEHFGGEVSNDG